MQFHVCRIISPNYFLLSAGRSLLTPANQRQFSPVLSVCHHSTDGEKKPSRRRGKTPAGKFDDKWETETEESIEPYQEQEPLERHPDNKNPVTGEIGGPKGPEPTRYGDWERKGRVTDF